MFLQIWVVLQEQELWQQELKLILAIIDKRRPAPGKSQVMNIIGDVKNKTCIIVDDIIDSGGTIINAVDALKKKVQKKYMYLLLMPF